MKRRPKQIRTILNVLIRKMSEHPEPYIRCPEILLLLPALLSAQGLILCTSLGMKSICTV